MTLRACGCLVDVMQLTRLALHPLRHTLLAALGLVACGPGGKASTSDDTSTGAASSTTGASTSGPTTDSPTTVNVSTDTPTSASGTATDSASSGELTTANPETGSEVQDPGLPSQLELGMGANGLLILRVPNASGPNSIFMQTKGGDYDLLPPVKPEGGPYQNFLSQTSGGRKRDGSSKGSYVVKATYF